MLALISRLFLVKPNLTEVDLSLASREDAVHRPEEDLPLQDDPLLGLGRDDLAVVRVFPVDELGKDHDPAQVEDDLVLGEIDGQGLVGVQDAHAAR